jgi:predicted N-formylglutamate amidohydrolase
VTDSADNALLVSEDGPAVWAVNPGGMSPVLVICDHASNRIPKKLGTLSVPPDVLATHVAWDPGAYEVASNLARLLDAPLIASGFSRLVYDVNRPPDSPQAIRDTSEVYEIPGNRDLDESDRAARVAAIYAPFHDRIDALIAERQARGQVTALVTVHSFTPVYHGRQREVELGILHDADARLADALLAIAAGSADLLTLRNEPYGPDDGVTHTLVRHAAGPGLLNAMIEIRNDLIATSDRQAGMARLLAEMLARALSGLGVVMDGGRDKGAGHARGD